MSSVRRHVVLVALAALGLAGCPSGPVPQAPVCAQYLECQRAIDEQQGSNAAASVEDLYGPDGACWASSADAARCESSCQQTLEVAAADIGATLEACGGTPPGDGDAGADGGSAPDGGSPADGGPSDGGTHGEDGGPGDAGPADGGGAPDGGPTTDGGALDDDAGPADGGLADGGRTDGGLPDAGAPDAGPSDGGPGDGG